MVAYVILHYIALDMTIKAVNSIIKNNDAEDYRIIIIDNASPNGSGNELKEYYKHEKRCIILLNEENLGFAKGNNVGYIYAKNNFSPDYIVVMNNDVIIDDREFEKKIEIIFQNSSFFVMGPDILSMKAFKHQNPLREQAVQLEKLDEWIDSWDKILKMSQRKYIIFKIKNYFFKILFSITRKKHQYDSEMRLLNPVLHGACLVFSSLYIQKEDIAFNPNTFLYFEEDILHHYCMEKGYTMVLDKTVSVKHYEDVSTDSLRIKRYDKEMNKYRNLLQSGKYLYALLLEKRGGKNDNTCDKLPLE